MIEARKKYVLSCLPSDNPYLNDGWRPSDTEWTASTPDLQGIGDLPKDLNGVYLRNGPNPRLEPNGNYHPFDGDGMIHAAHFDRGRVTYRNKWVRTDAMLEETRAGASPLTAPAWESSSAGPRNSPIWVPRWHRVCLKPNCSS